MEGDQQEPPPALIPRYWLPGWNSEQARDQYRIEADALPGSGSRLLEPAPSGQAYEPARPEPPLEKSEIWLVPRAAIFGSEELSRLAPAIAEMTPPPALALHPDEAQARGLEEGDPIAVTAEGDRYLLELRLDARIARGVACAPAGYPETAGLDGPVRARLEKLL